MRFLLTYPKCGQMHFTDAVNVFNHSNFKTDTGID